MFSDFLIFIYTAIHVPIWKGTASIMAACSLFDNRSSKQLHAAHGTSLAPQQYTHKVWRWSDERLLRKSELKTYIHTYIHTYIQIHPETASIIVRSLLEELPRCDSIVVCYFLVPLGRNVEALHIFLIAHITKIWEFWLCRADDPCGGSTRGRRLPGEVRLQRDHLRSSPRGRFLPRVGGGGGETAVAIVSRASFLL